MRWSNERSTLVYKELFFRNDDSDNDDRGINKQ